ncbi:MAG TPA: ATP-dependent DNA helicase PcrA, partial [candidate division WWE3 bacterium]|nr:ATP-dependent DNA helicase PcrA [candidate division WWE3 bacterium]
MSTLFDQLNDQQISAVSHQKGPALVVAGPGSGKTRVLTHRIAYLIEACSVSQDQILTVTFTNKAAGEIKERVSHLLEGNKKPSWSGTFHS